MWVTDCDGLGNAAGCVWNSFGPIQSLKPAGFREATRMR